MDTMEMMKSMSMGDMPVDMDAMQTCMMSMNACSMAATMCAADDMAMGAHMAKCAALCSNMADMADACMRMMMRPAGMTVETMTAMMAACVAMGRACSAECAMHAEMNEMCRYCAMACDDMVAACEAMMASMAA